MPHNLFHPLVTGWFAERFREPTAPQAAGWQEIASGRHTLIAAPTGSGKTLAAFLWSINRLIERGLAGSLPDLTQVLYISPLKALGNDIQKNLQEPLRGIRERADAAGLAIPEIRVAVRSGDTPASDRARMLRKPPHILITTPESLFILLTAEGSRQFLSSVETAIVDEIHAVAGDKRGSHLAISLERLDALTGRPVQRIGLSATQRPIEEIAALLVGTPPPPQPSPARGEGASPIPSAQAPTPAQARPHPNPLPEAEGEIPSPHRDAENLAPITHHPIPSSQHPTPNSQPPTPNSQPPTPNPQPPTPPSCAIVDVGHKRPLELTIEVPDQELGPIATHELWAEIYERIVAQVNAHRTTLVFVNTRRLVERVAHQLGQRLGDERVAAHHGSLSRETRLAAEQALKTGSVPVMVATASLELGIDIGYVNLVCHIGAPRLFSTLLQRVGRSGHWLGATPKGILFPLTRDDLLQCAAAIRGVRAGELDRISVPEKPLDILAQQMVAIAASGPIEEGALFDLIRRSYPYRNLEQPEFDAVLEVLSEGIATGRGRRSAHLHRDRVHGIVRPRRGARLAAITSGGAIPDVADYEVIEEPAGTLVGRVHEDFAVEALAGDIFLLGNRPWRIRRVENGRVRVEDAHGSAPTIPFWLGEAPARSWELSGSVSALREEVMARLAPRGAAAEGRTFADGVSPAGDGPADLEPLGVAAKREILVGDGPATSVGVGPAHLNDRAAAIRWLEAETGVPTAGAEQIVDYVAATVAVLGTVPTQRTVIAERFFDESGGMQLVVHAPFGGAINRAWGLSLRKRFCVTFDYELQAAATDDGIVISLGERHSFPLESVFHMVRPATLESDLTQAALQSPMFTNRWRWNASRALALLRLQNGRRVPMNIQRMRAEDLLAAVFPDQIACQDNRNGGPIVLPDHPLVTETVDNCLHEAMNVDALREILLAIERGEIATVAVETPVPSAMSHEILNANPYAFLDDAPLEERRARAVTLRRTDPDLARGVGALDPEAIGAVRAQAWPDVRDAEELHDFLLSAGLLPVHELGEWAVFADELVASGRATMAAWKAVTPPAETGEAPTPPPILGEGPADPLSLWERAGVRARPSALVAAERLQMVEAVCGPLALDPPIQAPPGIRDMEEDEAGTTIVQGWLEAVGPTTASALADRLGLSPGTVEIALAALEGRGVALRGRFTREAAPGAVEWCERRLLARIHHLTLGRLRREIEPVSAADLIRFLLRWQHVAPGAQLHGQDGLAALIGQLQGLELPAPAWESWVLPRRLANYEPADLERLCLAGLVAWGRLSHREPDEGDSGAYAPPPPVRQAHGAAVDERTMSGTRLDSLTGGRPGRIRRKRAPAPGRQAPLAFLLREDLPMLLEPRPLQTATEIDTPSPQALRQAQGRLSPRGRGEDRLSPWERPARPRQRAQPGEGVAPNLADAHGGPDTEEAAALPGSHDAGLSSAAREVATYLERHGASFLTEIARGTKLVPAAVEDALWELVASGYVTGDGIAGLRVLLQPEAKRRQPRRHLRSIRGGLSSQRMIPVGRWSLWGRGLDQPGGEQRAERFARQLLRRYGVVFREVLAREGQAPPWRTLLGIYRRMEARGELRGGRFVAGFVGEQFALPEAVEALRAVRRIKPSGETVLVHSGDPLNLVGVLTPGSRVSPFSNQVIAYRDGQPVEVGSFGAVRSLLQLRDA